MRVSVQEDLSLSREDAFSAVVDLDYLERQLLRRGIDVARTDMAENLGAGWRATLPLAGQSRDVTGRITEWDSPSRGVLEAVSGGLNARVAVEFTALSVRTTRMRVDLELAAIGLREKLVLKTLQLSQRKWSEKFERIVVDFARDAERRGRIA